ncbi:MAG: hypothetical protein D6B27_07200 [Gammaproteobacteria bacterium]|nr:MAG: hypothetical protein D6B27_07200 [Gammaproteobacteria bacterium]
MQKEKIDEKDRCWRQIKGCFMFWIWMTEPQSEADDRIYSKPDVVSKYDLDFDSGCKQPIKEIPTIEIHISEDQSQNLLTDNLIAPGITGIVINRKIRSILQENNVSNIEYYNSILIDEIMGKKETDYKIGNIIGLIRCVDFEKSELVIDDHDGSIQFIDKLVLKYDLLKDIKLPIFRLGEFSQIILVHNAIKNELESANVSGINFYKPEEFVL